MNTENDPDGEQGIIKLDKLNVYYGDFHAVDSVSLSFPPRKVTALIGPSGCGKSTVLRSINRMNETIPGTRVNGSIYFHDSNIYRREVDPVAVRRRIGMVFQKPNPFPKSIYDNIAWGARINGFTGNMDELVENSLKRAALWSEVKDKLKQNALRLSGGQQQRLCIARSIAVEPEVILMDEPASALDPIATAKIEELIAELKENYSIIIVTHNMHQAGRISDRTAFFLVNEKRAGVLVEYGPTDKLFLEPEDPRTEKYISGKFG
ncbi:MAG: phosphate ABC transporter ATP-binding protein [Spirochaetales bacterium]|nr:phosphate ABC transporter ATP-binding protein [Spirochaetales bacterium]